MVLLSKMKDVGVECVCGVQYAERFLELFEKEIKEFILGLVYQGCISDGKPEGRWRPHYTICIVSI